MPDFAWEKAKTNSYTKFFLIFSARNEKQKKTRIADCCARSTECSEHIFEKIINFFFSIECRFFFVRSLIKKIERKPKT